MTKKKNPILAALLGFLVYPLGYFYVGHFWRGLAVFFLVPLILSPFMPQSQLLLAENFSSNLSANVSLNLSNATSNESLSNLLSPRLNQSALFNEIVSVYTSNPILLFLDFFLRTLIALDCFFIARRINAGVVESKPESPEVSANVHPLEEGMLYPPNVDVYCPKCRIGLAMVLSRCPNCGADLRGSLGKEK